MGLAFVSCLLKVKKMFGTVNPCFDLLLIFFFFLMNKISFYFCDLFIVKMLRIWSYPSKNKETNRIFHLEFDAETESSLTHTWVTDFWFGDMLRIILLRNTHKKWVNTYENSLYVWCWFVMFASESSHASSFKISWICDTQKTATHKEVHY